MTQEVPPGIAELVRRARSVVVLSGAGMSADSGVPTFRDAQTGLWENFDAASLATPEAWTADPDLVWAWYEWRRALVRQSEPNAGHRAITSWGERVHVQIVTQNVDDLHERAGSPVLAHVHGSLFTPRCSDCGLPAPTPDPPPDQVQRLTPPRCVACNGLVRPGVVWFGENLPSGPWQRAVAAVEAADLLVVVGTSGVVYPAAGLPAAARAAGVPTVEINPVASELTDQVDHSWRVSAAVGLPLLAGCA